MEYQGGEKKASLNYFEKLNNKVEKWNKGERNTSISINKHLYVSVHVYTSLITL